MFWIGLIACQFCLQSFDERLDLRSWVDFSRYNSVIKKQVVYPSSVPHPSVLIALITHRMLEEIRREKHCAVNEKSNQYKI